MRQKRKRAAVLAADPPWKFKDNLPGKKRGATKHYQTMTIHALCDFPLPPLSRNCVLFMWRVSSMVEEAYMLLRAWGFEPKSELVWKKTTKRGKRHFGMGRYARMEHEACIIAVRGKPRLLDKSVRSVFEAAIGRHSEKPAAFFAIVEKMYAGPYVELFARKRRKGWTCHGNEL